MCSATFLRALVSLSVTKFTRWFWSRHRYLISPIKGRVGQPPGLNLLLESQLPQRHSCPELPEIALALLSEKSRLQKVKSWSTLFRASPTTSRTIGPIAWRTLGKPQIGWQVLQPDRVAPGSRIS